MALRTDDSHTTAEDPAQQDPEATAPAAALPKDDTRERKDHIGKRLFASARLVEDMLRGFLPPDVVGEVDYATLDQRPPEILAEDGLRRTPDALWAADRPGGGKLLVMIELQTTSPVSMAARMMVQTGLIYENLPDKLLASDGSHPAILPLVVYCGDGQWTATENMASWTRADDPTAAEYLAEDRYAALDAMALGREDVPDRNRMGVFAKAHASESAEDVVRDLREAFAWIGRDELKLRVDLLHWVYVNGKRLSLTLAERRSLDELEEEAMMDNGQEEGISALEANMRRWTAEWEEQGRKQGLEQGREQGREQAMDHERGVLLRQAGRRFGPETGDRLATLLAGVGDPSRLERVGDLIVDCDDGNELLDRLNGQPSG